MSKYDDPYLRAVRVEKENLIVAMKEMNTKSDCFQSRVIKLIDNIENHDYILIIELEGSYPFITNEWSRTFLLDWF